QTRTGLVKGKFSYMSPEQCLGQSLDRRNDVFALGIVLFELCTARRLFKRGSTYETYTAITNAHVPAPRTLNAKIPESIEAVIMRALAKNRDDRYETADAMQDALEDAMRKASLRGSPTDLAKFMMATFAAEEAEQRRLLLRAQRGELDNADEAAQVSPVAAAAAAEMNANYVVDNERTSIDLLPPLGEDSGRNWKADVDLAGADLEDSQEDVKTRAQDFPRAPTSATTPAAGEATPMSQATTEPRGVPSLRGQIPTIYYVFAIAAVLLIVIIAWVIAR
ncbi:MAG: hypothetical protein JWM53_4364, partial [bacterium]|nr:hypothetical protein [bacterium]